MMVIENYKTIIRKLLSLLFGRKAWAISTICTDIVAFDMFDTLIYREGAYFSTEVFDMVGKKLGINDFKAMRVNAEKKARKSALEKDGEVFIEEIYKELASDMGWGKEYSDSVRNKEIEIEMEICKANAYMKRLFDDLLEQGKKVVIVSDMYMDKCTLAKILNKQGYNLDGVELFISSEYGCSKRTGNLFRVVISELNIKANEIVMIGDNIISDYLIPKKLGMNAMLYRKGKA